MIRPVSKFAFALACSAVVAFCPAFGAALKYSRYPATSTFLVGSNWPWASSKVMKPSSYSLNESLLPYIFGHINDRDFTDASKMKMSDNVVVMNGKDAEDVNYASPGT